MDATFTQEQSEQIKKQLLEQVEKLEIENKEQIKDYIESLDETGLENFLKQNNIQLSNLSEQQGHEQKSIFELILNNELPSYKIAENKYAIGVLELNPLSKGHSLVIPKQKTTIEKIQKTAFFLAKKLSKKIKSKFKPIDIKIETFSFQNYPAINIIPIYENKELKKERAGEEELKELQSILETKPRIKTYSEKTKKSIKKLPEISFRIP